MKQGKNFWVVIFDHYLVPVESKVGRFRFYDKSALLSSLSNRYINLGEKQTITIKNRLLTLSKGLWFVEVCNNTNDDEFVSLEFEDYYTLLNTSLDKNQCTGNYFYHECVSPLQLSVDNNVNEVNVFPVVLN